MLRRLLAMVVTAVLVTGASALGAGPVEAAKVPAFDLWVHLPSCSDCDPPHTRAQGEGLALTGSVAHGNKRPYTIQERPVGGRWSVVRSKKTRRGYGSATLRHEQVGTYEVRAVAKKYHGLRKAVSKTIRWTVLTRTTVTAAFSANPAPANSRVTVSGQLTPAGARYVTVVLVDEPPGKLDAWSVLTKPDGTFSLSVQTYGPGRDTYQIISSQTADAAKGFVRLPTLVVS